jgi:hypothetical protein
VIWLGIDLGSQAVDYARVHPDDKDVPESLYLTLRMVRYGCFHGYGGEKPGANHVSDIGHQVVVLTRTIRYEIISASES